MLQGLRPPQYRFTIFATLVKTDVDVCACSMSILCGMFIWLVWYVVSLTLMSGGWFGKRVKKLMLHWGGGGGGGCSHYHTWSTPGLKLDSKSHILDRRNLHNKGTCICDSIIWSSCSITLALTGVSACTSGQTVCNWNTNTNWLMVIKQKKK